MPASPDPARHLVIAGLGYAGSAVARAAAAHGWRVTGTARDPEAARPPEGVAVIGFAEAGPVIRGATHLLVNKTLLAQYAKLLAAHKRQAPAS